MTKEDAVAIVSEIRSDYNFFDKNEQEEYHALSMAIEALQEQKTGKWWRRAWSIECSECGHDMPFAIRNYCPNCGAKMENES